MNKTLAILSLAAAALGASAQTPRGVDRANLDPTVAPGTDFYDYACGGWMKANPLKAEYSRYGTFDQLGELNRSQVRDLVLGLDARTAAPGSNAQKIADLYAMGMDSTRLNAEGAAAIQADLKRIYAAGRADIITISRDDVVAGLEMFRDGDVTNKKYQAKLFDTFLVAVYVYDDDMKIVFSFSGRKNTVSVPLDAALVDGIETSAEGKVRIGTLLSHQTAKVRTPVQAGVLTFLLCVPWSRWATARSASWRPWTTTATIRAWSPARPLAGISSAG